MNREGYQTKIHSLYLITVLFLLFKSSSCLKASLNINLSIKELTKGRHIKSPYQKGNQNMFLANTTKGNITIGSNKFHNDIYFIPEPDPNINLLQKQSISLIQRPVYLSSNFSILSSTNNSIFNVLNHKTNKTTVYDTEYPFDEYQFAFNIQSGCSINNCKYPSVCLNETTCACDNFYANFFPNHNEKDIKNQDKNCNFCSYKRKDPLTLSFFEIFLPGIGFIYNGFYFYGTIKCFISLILITIMVLKLGRFLEKDKLLDDVDNFECVEYKKDFHFYLMIASFAILSIWYFVDLITISYRFRTDPNGVHFRLGYLIDEMLSY